jgi:MinD-like ATPase involved in chromosome partitioning or flagellar assembly
VSTPRSRASSDGRVVTFYSYKGGTGRSMALANVAWLLAFSGRRVLVIDWDLEAPGVHRYFHPFLEDKDLTSTDGLFDFIENLASRSASSQEPLAPKDVNILDYVSMLSWPAKSGVTWQRFGARARIDLLSAGRQGPTYSRRLTSFSWSDFYERLKGRQLLAVAREQLRSIYDYVLIDSRTGVSDTSGICTVEMPDTLVVCFTLNDQSIAGASGVAESVVNERNARLADEKFRESRQLRVFPVPMRVEVQSEKLKRDVALKLAERKFASFVAQMNETQRRDYWGNIQAQYIPFYAFEEIPAVFGDAWNDQLALVNRFRHLADRLVGSDSLTVRQFADDFEDSEILRKTFLKAYLRSSEVYPDNTVELDDSILVPRPLSVIPGNRSRTASLPGQETRNDEVRFFISSATADRHIAEALREELQKISGRVRCFLDFQSIDSRAGWEKQLTDALVATDWLIFVYTGELSEFAGFEVGLFGAANKESLGSHDARLTCLSDVPELPSIFRGYQNCLVVFPQANAAPTDEDTFYAQSPLGRFFTDLCRYKDLYVPRDESQARSQIEMLTRQVKRITEAFVFARRFDILASTPTQLGVEVVVSGKSDSDLSRIPDDTVVKGSFSSLALFSLMPAMSNNRLPETTWRALREAVWTRSTPTWMNCLERDMVRAANQRTLTGVAAIFASGSRIFRAILARHIRHQNGDHRFEVLFVEETPLQTMSSKASTVLAGLVLASRFRFAYLEEPDIVASKFSDMTPHDTFEANCWQLRYDLDRSQHEPTGLGSLDPIAFVRAVGEENKRAAEQLVTESAMSLEKLLATLPAYGTHIEETIRPRVKAAIEDFLRTYGSINDNFLKLSLESYRHEMLRELEHPSVSVSR